MRTGFLGAFFGSGIPLPPKEEDTDCSFLEHFRRGRQQGWEAGLAVRDMEVRALQKEVSDLKSALQGVQPIIEHYARNPLALQAQAAKKRVQEVLS